MYHALQAVWPVTFRIGHGPSAGLANLPEMSFQPGCFVFQKQATNHFYNDKYSNPQDIILFCVSL